MLQRGDVVVYVGRTRNLFYRVGQHITDGKEFDSFSQIPCESELHSMEIEFLEIVSRNPILNRSCGHSEAAGYLNAIAAKAHFGVGKRALNKMAKAGVLETKTYSGITYYFKGKV